MADCETVTLDLAPWDATAERHLAAAAGEHGAHYVTAWREMVEDERADLLGLYDAKGQRIASIVVAFYDYAPGATELQVKAVAGESGRVRLIDTCTPALFEFARKFGCTRIVGEVHRKGLLRAYGKFGFVPTGVNIAAAVPQEGRA